MAKILDEDSLPVPKLSLKATAKPRDATGTDEITAGLHVLVTAELTREHAAAPGEGTKPACNNPQGIYEAYWLYVEGLKPVGTPNSLIVAKPLVVTDLESKAVTAEVSKKHPETSTAFRFSDASRAQPTLTIQAVFQAPPNPGTYTLRAHVTSTSVIGIQLQADVTFTVVEDDVPDLE